MKSKISAPYQPLLLRLLHGLSALFVIGAIITAYWTYDTYDGRWGRIPLPEYKAIEGIHGTFGVFALLIFPLFTIYAFRRGQQKLIQSDSLKVLSKIGKPIWWYTLHRLANTLSILALTFAVFSGRMMNEKWLPQGELNHFWYYAHLISWVIMVLSIAIHLLMSAKVGGTPLLLSIIDWRFRSSDSPSLWHKHISQWRHTVGMKSVINWLQAPSVGKILEALILISIIAAWIIPILKS